MNWLVLDLRSNPGGSLDEAIALSDLFLDKGRIVSQRGRARGETANYDAEMAFRGAITSDLPIVVLIDAGSASASEIVAGEIGRESCREQVRQYVYHSFVAGILTKQLTSM